MYHNEVEKQVTNLHRLCQFDVDGCCFVQQRKIYFRLEDDPNTNKKEKFKRKLKTGVVYVSFYNSAVDEQIHILGRVKIAKKPSHHSDRKGKLLLTMIQLVTHTSKLKLNMQKQLRTRNCKLGF